VHAQALGDIHGGGVQADIAAGAARVVDPINCIGHFLRDNRIQLLAEQTDFFAHRLQFGNFFLVFQGGKNCF
jgi:hypothetical protein